MNCTVHLNVQILQHDGICSVCYLQWCGLLVHWNNENHQLVVNTQVAKDITLWYGDMQTQNLQNIVDCHWLVPIQLKAHHKIILAFHYITLNSYVW